MHHLEQQHKNNQMDLAWHLKLEQVCREYCVCQTEKTMQYVSHSFVLPIFISSRELKLVRLAGWDREQLLEGDSMTSSSQLWHKSWPLLKQQGWRVTVCLGHHHRKMSRAKRDTYPTTLPLPSHPLGALNIDFTLKAVWCVQLKPTSGRLTMPG